MIRGWLRGPSTAELAGETSTATLPGYHRQMTKRQYTLKYVVCLAGFAIVCATFGFLFAIFPPSFYLYLIAPIVVAALVAVWALPETEKPYPRIVTFLFFGYLISVAIWPNYLALALPGLPWITSNRLFTVPLLLAFLVSLSVSSDFKKKIAEPLIYSKPAMIALIIFVALQFLTLGFSATLASSATRFVNAQLEFTMLLLVSLWIFSVRANMETFLKLCIFFCLYQFALGITEFITQSIFWASIVPNFLMGDQFLVSKILAGSSRFDVGTHRSQGTFTTSLSYAEFLGILQPFMLYAVFFGKSLLHRLLGIACFFMALTGIILSQSRLGLVGTMVGILLFSLIMALRFWRSHRTSLLPPAIILAYPVGAGMFVALTLVWNRLSTMVWGGGETASSNASRAEQYEVGLRKIFSWPFGYGMGNSGREIGMISANGQYNIDTYYILIGIDNGIIGFIAYAFLHLYLVYKTAYISINRPTASVYNTALIPISCSIMAFFIIKSVLSQEDTHTFMFVILGLAIAALYQEHLETKKAG